MDIQIRKINLIQKLINIESENLITIIENVINKSYNDRKDFRTKMSSEIFEKRIMQSLQDIEVGKVTSMEDLELEMEKW
jgi:O6-methylguanine-DNA--protein-cysteine methyltransferase